MNADMKEKLASVAAKLGNTPIVDLGDGVFGKDEGKNPAGSIKDRAAAGYLRAALASGALAGGGTVVEATSGNLGIGLAVACRKLDLRLILTMPASASRERVALLRGLGATVVLTPAELGMQGSQDKVDELMANFDARITALSEFAAGKTAIVGLVTSGSYNVLGNDGRCSMIGREIGFENIGVDANIDTSTHGNEASFEFIVEKAPDYIFVLDRDAAIGTDGAKLAQEIMENELVMGTDAYKNGNIVYLAHPAVWYTAEGGISALDIMLQDLESELLG